MSLGVYTRWAALKAVELVNEFGDVEVPVSQARLFELLQRYSVSEEDLDPAAFAELAASIRHVFLDPDRAVRSERLNALLARFRPSPRIVVHDRQDPHFHYVLDGDAAIDHVGSSFVMSLATALVDESADRFGWCAAPNCNRLFFDQSRGHSQRFCSKSCATRVHVAAHRARS